MIGAVIVVCVSMILSLFLSAYKKEDFENTIIRILFVIPVGTLVTLGLNAFLG